MNARVLIFWETGFPFVDTTVISDAREIIEALPPMESVRSVGTEELKARLKIDSTDLFINPYGSSFPVDAWPEIREFLRAGGNLLNIGGAPFRVPVTQSNGGWEAEPSEDTYHRQLGIRAIETIDTSETRKFDTLPEEPLLSGLVDDLICEKSFALDIALSQPSGLSGKPPFRERTIRPLLFAVDKRLTSPGWMAAPVIAVDHTYGEFAGGRWVLANFVSGGHIRREIFTRLAGYCAEGPSEFQIRASFACYYPDERATLILHANRFERPDTETKPLNLFIIVRKEKITIHTESFDITDFRSPYYKEIRLGTPLSPGLYTVEARLSTGDKDLTDKFSSHHVTGFWCCDDPLISLTQRLSAGKNTFVRSDKPSLLVGTAYSDAVAGSRLFFDANPALWHRDFAQLDEAGVNIIRTGFTTGWRRVMMETGAPSEEVLRAITAFMLTAAQYDLSVVFSIFDTMPEAWHGENTYLDPAALYAQKEFVAALTRRLRNFNNLMWEIIDRPIASDSAATCEEMTASVEGLGKWVAEMAQVVRQNCNPAQIVTVGHSEDMDGSHLSPWFYADSMDFAMIHSDGTTSSDLMGRISGKPCMVAETSSGQDSNYPGKLQRNLVSAIASGASAVVERLWDQQSDDVMGGSSGLRRVDRSQKPEYETLPVFRNFLKELRHWYTDRQAEDVCIVIPQSEMLAHPVRAKKAVKTSIQAMESFCGVPVRTIGEYSLKDIGKPRLIIVPSTSMFKQKSWETLIKAVEKGAVLLVTGTINKNERGSSVDRLSRFGIEVNIREVSETERIIIFGTECLLEYGHNDSNIEMAVVGGMTGQVKTQSVGDGKLVYAPLPFELSATPEPAATLYNYALKQAVVDPPCICALHDPQIQVRPLILPKAILYCIMSDSEKESVLSITDSFGGHSYTLLLSARQSGMFLTNRADGSIISAYNCEADKD